MYGSEENENCNVSESALLYKRENIPFSASMPYDEVNITIPITQQLLNNGSYFAHIFFGKASSIPSPETGCVSSFGLTHTVYRAHYPTISCVELNRYKQNMTAAEQVNLLTDDSTFMVMMDAMIECRRTSPRNQRRF